MPPIPLHFPYEPTPQTQIDAADVIDRLQKTGMESLVIDDIVLDDTQARVTLTGVPNEPGIAAAVFDRVAANGIFVDMIVQSYADERNADISFTVPAEQFDVSLDVATQIQQEFECNGLNYKSQIAKLTVSGIGLRSHTGVAVEMFKALHEANINVDMINTSEVRVNVVVDGGPGTGWPGLPETAV